MASRFCEPGGRGGVSGVLMEETLGILNTDEQPGKRELWKAVHRASEPGGG